MQKAYYVLGCQSSQSLWIVYICIHVYFNSSDFSNKKKTSWEIWGALKLGFILCPLDCRTSAVGSSVVTAHTRDIFPCVRYTYCCSWYIAWESNNRIEVADQDVLKWYGLCYDRISWYDTMKFGIHTQSAELRIFQTSHPRRECLAVCQVKHTKSHILKQKTSIFHFI
jgi:hypothetical protein